MPLIHGKSDETRSENIATEIRHGKSPEQASAIAYNVQREAKASDTAALVESSLPESVTVKEQQARSLAHYQHAEGK